MIKPLRFFNLLPGIDTVNNPKTVVNQDQSEATIYMYDEISEYWGISAKGFAREVNELNAATIHLRINSPGGDIFEARAIQTLMAQHSATFIAHIDGLAASAMSFLIRGANQRVISDGGFIMIHQAIGGIYGNASELISRGNALAKIDDTLIEEYAKMTGQEEDTIKTWIEAETWFSAKDALEYGFVNEITEASPMDNIFDLSGYKNTPENYQPKPPKETATYDMNAIARRIRLAEACI